MKKLKTLVACAAILTLTGCGTVADLSVTPYGIAQKEGVEAAKAWCTQREIDVSKCSGVGRFIDVPFKVVAAPVEALVGPVVHGTTAVRDSQCEALQVSKNDRA